MLSERVLLKISGEALAGGTRDVYDYAFAVNLARDVAAVRESGIQLCLVVGGGNIVRGDKFSQISSGYDEISGDDLGMLATVMNGLFLQNVFNAIGLTVSVFSAIQIDKICNFYRRADAELALQSGNIVIFVGGTGNACFTTDTTAVLRAIEHKCSAVYKGTKVDGVYSADPMKSPLAMKYENITYDEVLAHKLKVMDETAIALAQTKKMPLVVFNITKEYSFKSVVLGESKNFTKIS